MIARGRYSSGRQCLVRVREGQKLFDFLNRKRRVVFRDFLDRTAEFCVLDNLVSKGARTLHHGLPGDFAGDAFNQVTSCPVHGIPHAECGMETWSAQACDRASSDTRVHAEFLKPVKNGTLTA